MNTSRIVAAGAVVLLGGGMAGAVGCGGDDSSTPPASADGGEGGLPDAGVDSPSDSTVPDTATPDAGIDTGIDAGSDAETGSSCAALSITAIAPAQGWTGIDVGVTITGTGFAACSADGGAACADRFKLVATMCAPGLDAGADAATDAGCGDGGTTEWALTNVAVTSATGVTATVPAGGPVGGPYTLVDTQGSCTAQLPAAYTILPATVTVSKVTPAYGWTGADTPITITGAGFVSTPRVYIKVPGLTPALQKLHSAAFVSTGSLSAVVPKGLTVGGPYEIEVVNPDNTGGTFPAAFRVTTNPSPTITNVSPASLTTSQLGAANNVTVTGCNFRAGATLSVVDAANTVTAETAGTLTCSGAQTCPGNTKICTLTGTIGALSTGPYLVRVTDTDEGTSGDYSSLVVTNPSAKLSTGFTTSPKTLGTPRRSLATTAARINDASRFLYAIGGENAAGTALASVEVAPLDLFGTLGDWFVQRSPLNSARSGATVAQLGGYVYVIGGTASAGGTGGAAPSGTPLNTIERAKILDLTDLPTLADPTTSASGSLAAGTWYYRVAVVRDATDPNNPNGEGLPSDEAVVTLSAKGSAVLTWTAPTNAAHLAKYRIYRSPAVNGASQSEVMLAETTNGVTLTYTDDGSVTPLAQKPLQRGSLGTFVTLASTLKQARFNSNATLAADSTGALFVYVTGGHGKCAAMASAGTMNCYEYAPISADGATLGAWTEDTTRLFITARERHGTATMNAANGYAGWPIANPSFVFVTGGLGPSQPSQSVEYATVTTGGALGAWSSGLRQFATKRDGSQLQIANGYLYAFLGGNGGGYTSSIDLSNATDVTTTPISLSSWSNATASPPVSLGRMGVTLESAYFYVIGGTLNDTDAQAAVYQVVY